MVAMEMYRESAALYDDFFLKGKGETTKTNQLILHYLQANNVNSLLDMSCGTGAQAIFLAKAGYQITASDINQGMLDVAQRKSSGIDITFHQADMTNVSLGKKYDAIITMFNSVGHLTKAQLLTTFINAKNNLNANGILIFDIFNRDVMPLVPKHKFIDCARHQANTFFVKFTQFDFNTSTGMLNVSQTELMQKGIREMLQKEQNYSLQAYKKNELIAMLDEAGFNVVTVKEHGLSDFYESDDPVVDCLMHFVVAKI